MTNPHIIYHRKNTQSAGNIQANSDRGCHNLIDELVIVIQPLLRRTSTGSGGIIGNATDDEEEARVLCAVGRQRRRINRRAGPYFSHENAPGASAVKWACPGYAWR